jgi:ABC-2 type transport system permease protein
MTKVWTIARYNLLRMFRERANLFFVLIFPILVIWILGTQFGDDAPEIAVRGQGEFAERVVERLEATGSVDVRRVEDAAELADLVDGGTLPLGVDLPGDAEDQLLSGEGLGVTVLVGQDDETGQLELVVARALRAEAVVPGVIGQLTGASDLAPEQVSSVVAETAAGLPEVQVDRVLAGGGDPDDEPIGMNQIAVGMLLLMTFLNALTGAAALIQSRRYGVSRRMIATPTSLRTVVVGEGIGRWSVGMFQALYIMIATALIFGVEWGNLPTAVVVVALFAAVAGGAAMLIGAVMQNDEQAAGVTVMAGLALGALGGSMLPLELFGSTMRTIAHVTPHAWAIDAFTEMGRHGGTFVDVLPQLAVLAAMALVLIGLAAWRLRVTLTRV